MRHRVATNDQANLTKTLPETLIMLPTRVHANPLKKQRVLGQVERLVKFLFNSLPANSMSILKA